MINKVPVYRNQQPSLSKKSADSALEQFRQAVDRMEQTILVPTKLMDMPLTIDTTSADLNSENVSDAISVLSGAVLNFFLAELQEAMTDLHNIYTTLRSLRDELNWTGLATAFGTPTESLSAATAGLLLGNSRQQPWTGSMASLVESSSSSSAYSSYGGSSGSDSESLAGEETASSIGGSDVAVELTDQFRRHVTGLHRTMERMTHMAGYVTQRYQAEVGCDMD